ncbi:MAG: hypothetical protein NUV80_07360, partial [Candidatus Berkelbacteria bacterium]|nr:hypothetical protein [Candidatus Berkelbacteria bacterium]
MTLKNLMGQQKMQEREMAQTDIADRAWANSGGDLTKFGQLLAKEGGGYKTALAAQKAGLDAKNVQGNIDKTNIESSILKIKAIREIAAQVNSDADLPAAQEQVARIVGPDALSKIPFFNQPYDPEKQKQVIMSVDAKLADMKPDWKTVDAGGQIIQRQMNPNAPGFSSEPITKTAAPGDKRPFQITDAAGNTKLVDVQGNVIKDLGGIGKPTATHEKTVAAKKKLAIDLDQSIRELEKATADGGLIDKSTGSGIGAGV